MASENVTTKFRVDISDLNKNIEEAKRKIQQYRAELKNASAGMEKGEETADSLSKKIEAQGKIVEAEKAKLQAMKDELVKYEETLKKGEGIVSDLTAKHKEAAEAYGKDSDEAKKLAKQLKEAQAAQERNSKAADDLRLKIINQDTAVKNASAQVGKFEKELDDLRQSEIKAAEAEKKAAEAALAQEKADKALTNVVKKQEDELKLLKRQYADTAAAQGKDSAEAKRLSGEIETLSKSLKENRSKLDDAKQSADTFDKSLEEVGDEAEKTTNGGLKSFAVALGNLAAQVITKAVQGLGNLAKSVVDTGKAFDTSMSNVKAISGANDEEMDMLTEKAEALGAATKFTATEVADAFGYMGMAGWKAQDMIGGIDGVLALAAASSTDLATASDIVTDSLTAFGEGSGEAGRLSDIMAAAAANSNTNVEMMGETFKYVAPLAGALGFSMEDVAIATGLMANSGVKGTQAGTSLRSMLTRLTAPTKESQAAMDALGISIDDGQGNMKSMMEIMKDLRASFGDLKIPQEEFESSLTSLNAAFESGEISEDEFNEKQEELIKRAYGAEGAMKAQYASMLAGKNGLSGFLAIMNASDEDFDKLTDSIYNSEGAAQEMAATMLDNLGGDLTLLSSAFDGFKKALYDKLEQPLRELVQNVTGNIMPALHGILNGDQGAADELGEALENLFEKGFSMLAKALPGMLTAGGAILSALTLSILDAAPDLVDVVLQAASSVLSGLGKFLPRLTDKLGDLMQKLAVVLSQNLDPLLGAAGDLIDGLIGALLDPSILAKIVGAVGDILVAVADALASPGMTHLLESALIGIAVASLEATLSPELMGALAKLVTQIIAAVVKIAVALAPELVGASVMLIDEIIQTLMQTDWAGIGTAVLNSIVEGANSVDLTQFWNDWFSGFDDIKAWAKSAGDFLAKCWRNIKQTFSDVKGFFSRSFSDAWNAVKRTFSSVGSFFEGVWNTIRSKFTSIGTKIGDAVGGAFKSAVNAVISTVERNLNFIPSSINAMLDAINALPGVSISRMGTVSLPRLAKGGIVDRATLAQLGENGREAVIPLERNKRGLKEIAALLRDEMNGGGIRGGGSTVGGTVINLTQNNSSPKALSRYDIYRQTKNLLNAVGTGEAVGIVHT